MTGLAGWVFSFVLMLVAMGFAAHAAAGADDATDADARAFLVGVALAILAILVRP